MRSRPWNSPGGRLSGHGVNRALARAVRPVPHPHAEGPGQARRRMPGRSAREPPVAIPARGVARTELCQRRYLSGNSGSTQDNSVLPTLETRVSACRRDNEPMPELSPVAGVQLVDRLPVLHPTTATVELRPAGTRTEGSKRVLAAGVAPLARVVLTSHHDPVMTPQHLIGQVKEVRTRDRPTTPITVVCGSTAAGDHRVDLLLMVPIGVAWQVDSDGSGCAEGN